MTQCQLKIKSTLVLQLHPTYNQQHCYGKPKSENKKWKNKWTHCHIIYERMETNDVVVCGYNVMAFCEIFYLINQQPNKEYIVTDRVS